MGIVKQHTRKGKNGKMIIVKQHNRKGAPEKLRESLSGFKFRHKAVGEIGYNEGGVAKKSKVPSAITYAKQMDDAWNNRKKKRRGEIGKFDHSSDPFNYQNRKVGKKSKGCK